MRGRFGRTTVAVVIAMLTVTVMAAPASAELRVRKDVTKLTSAEWQGFVDAVYTLKATPSPWSDGSWYDDFVAWHVDLSRCESTDFLMVDSMAGHAGPMFLPWHREFLLLFEEALRAVSGEDVTVPYWDWTDPASIDVVLSDAYLGRDGDAADDFALKTGAFRKGQWTVDVQPFGTFSTAVPNYLQRKLGDLTQLPQASEIEDALGLTTYDVSPWDDASDTERSFRNTLEGFRTDPRTDVHGWSGCPPDGANAPHGFAGALPFSTGALHNIVHAVVGGVIESNGVTGRVGTFDNIQISPADPIFWLHHAMIDRVWAQWQEKHGVETYRSERGHNRIDDVMRPFEQAGVTATPRTVADTRVLGYVYDNAAAPRGRRRAASQRARRAGAVRFRRDHARFRALCRIARRGRG